MFFVIAIFLFFKSDVFAYSNGNYTIIDPPSVVLSSMQNNSDLLDNNHNYFIYCYGESYRLVTFNKSSTFKGTFINYYNFKFNENFTYKQYFYNPNGVLLSTSSPTNATPNNIWGGEHYDNKIVWVSNFPMYNSNYTNLVYPGAVVNPFIVNNTDTIINFSFNYLTINAGNLPYNDYYEIRYTYPNVNTIYTANIDKFKTLDNNILYFNIPKSFFTNDIVIRSGSRISFDLIKYHRQQPAVTSKTFGLGSYILNLTTEEETIINEDSNKQLLSDINNQQQETTNAINNLNNSQQETTNAINNLDNTITDTNIDDNSINLPTDNSNDITQDGLNGIFTSIYNAFCVGQAQDIIFPIPFTNKNITLQANYVRDMLSNNGATWLITIIEAFWWYLISRYIVKDITNKITKIKSGNIEDIENTNIKGDML